MAYQYTNKHGRTYFLNAKPRELKTGLERTLWFFSKDVKDTTVDALPDGYEVQETKTGLPILRRKVG